MMNGGEGRPWKGRQISVELHGGGSDELQGRLADKCEAPGVCVCVCEGRASRQQRATTVGGTSCYFGGCTWKDHSLTCQQ